MSYNSNNTYFQGYLNEQSSNPADAAFAAMWNAAIKEDRNRNNNNSYGSSYGGSMQTTTCNWGGFSNGSHVFSSSYYG
jgi:hypothetical protein